MVEEHVPPPEAEPEAPAAPPAASAPAEPQPAELSPAECAARLAALFPALFGPPPLKPIKLRIQADIQERAPGQFGKKTLSLFLHRHTTSTAYLKGLALHATRFDLDGQPSGEVAAEHKAAAEAELLRRREIVEAKKAAAREQHREQRREQARQQQQEARQAQDAEFAARRERAQLLRAFETSTLTRANFCALKQIAEAELEALLERARAPNARNGRRNPARPAARRPPPRRPAARAPRPSRPAGPARAAGPWPAPRPRPAPAAARRQAASGQGVLARR